MRMSADFDDLAYDYEWYQNLLATFKQAGYEFRSFEEHSQKKVVYLRHDVDFSPQKALTMAEIESEMDISSTYFFLVTASFYNALSAPNRRIIQKISDLGHEIGLHFAVQEYFDNEPESRLLRERIQADKKVLETVIDDVSNVVAFHNPPEWALGRRFEGLKSTYEPKFFEAIAYRSDSLQRWRENPPLKSQNPLPDQIQILIHPSLWGHDDQSATDQIKAAQNELIQQTDDEMDAFSRLDW